MIWLAIAWLMLWAIHACEVEKLLKEIIKQLGRKE